MSNADNVQAEEVTQPQPFTFQPPAGGDLVLQSCDGATFQAHSIILGMASTVFADMFNAATKTEAVELAEDAEAISVMLAFIYPIPTPQITTVELLEKVMICAQKYHIEKMLKFIEEKVYLDSDLLSLDPMRIFYTSVKHSFRNTQILAAKSISPGHCDFFGVEGLLQLAQYFPEAAPAIGLAGAQGVRLRILTKMLLQTPQEYGIYSATSQVSSSSSDTTNRSSSASIKSVSLPMCRSHGQTSRNNVVSVPSYCDVWLRRFFEELTKKPLHQCDAMTWVNSLATIKKNSGVCGDCIIEAFENPHRFEQWTQGVKRIIEIELEALDVLYSL